jgi:hypothetical protein
VADLDVLEERLQQWSVPSDVRAAVRRAAATLTKEGASLVEATVGDELAIAVRGQPAAVYVSASGVSVALTPPDADRAYRADSAMGLHQESESTWLVHCRYGRLDSSRLNTMTALMVKALRRDAPRPEPRQPVATTRRRASASSGSGSRTARENVASPGQKARRSTGRRTEEDRLRAVEAAIPRCPVPGCNLPMVGGSCGFHD